MEARKNLNLTNSSYIYGEILFFPFADILRSIASELPSNAIFYDLGSGTGKAVLAASLLYPFSKVVGIELLGVSPNDSGEVQLWCILIPLVPVT